MRYYFLRHGIAEDFSGSDFSRELTARGRRRVGTAAAVMKRLGLAPARIFSSPRPRAHQTAAIVAETLGMDLTISEALDFGFDLAAVQRLSQDLGADAEVMFVGHNPDMSLLVQQLTGCSVSMKKGGLARVDAFAAQSGQGELVWLIAPKVFDTLARDYSAALLTPPQKLPATSAEIHPLIKHRWSPVGFDRERGISRKLMLSLLEAARWSASSSNVQPWRFIVARREESEAFQQMLSVLREGNQPWARHAAALMLTAAHRYPKPEQYHRHASHDLGLAIGQLALQALHHGIYLHQMGGFYPEKARELYKIPEDFEPMTAVALGYRTAELEHLPERLRGREAGGRERHPLQEFVFAGSWGEAADFLP